LIRNIFSYVIQKILFMRLSRLLKVLKIFLICFLLGTEMCNSQCTEWGGCVAFCRQRTRRKGTQGPEPEDEGPRTWHLAADSLERRLKIENQFGSDLKQTIGGGQSLGLAGFTK